MSIAAFLTSAVLISLSGVMAPGPITAVIIGKGNDSPHAGAKVAIGHGIVEFPLMVLIFYGFGHLMEYRYVKEIIGITGGIFLLLMGISMIRSINSEINMNKYGRSPVVAGIVLTIGNPYFIIWWATVGATLIMESAAFGLIWFVVFAVLHWLCDFIWNYILSILSFNGGRFFGKRFQKISFIVCGIFLLFFSGKFIYDALISLAG